jgi:2',3'-cyclic-nucleotide 2'-phosphodiesterase (5'-nucleotidase family)
MKFNESSRKAPRLLLFLLVLFSCASSSALSAETLKLSILHMNDPHAHYAAEDGKDGLVGGFAKAQTVIKEQSALNSAEGRETLMLMAGDLLTGTPFSMVFKGKLGVALMNKMGFNVMTVGNHEFDYGQDNLLNTLKPLMQFPLLSANTKTSAGERVFDALVEKKFPNARTRVIIFGLTTAETPITTHPKNIKGLVFDDPIVTAKELLKDAKDVDLVIALTHIGIDEDKKLAEAVPKIDVIIGGHSHTKIPVPLKVRDTIICQADAYAKFVGKLNLEAVDGKVVKHEGELIHLGPGVKEDPEIAEVIERYKTEMGPEMEKVIGKTEVFLEGGRQAIRSGKDTNLGRMITSIMAEYARADAGVINGGGIRASIKEGDITMSDVYTALPFSNIVTKLDLTGADLLEMLQRSQDLEPGNGGKLQTFGIKYAEKDGKVRIESVHARQFDPALVYSVATNDFLAAGGDGYSVIKDRGKNCYGYAEQVSDLLIDFIKQHQVITADLIEHPKW